VGRGLISEFSPPKKSLLLGIIRLRGQTSKIAEDSNIRPGAM